MDSDGGGADADADADADGDDVDGNDGEGDDEDATRFLPSSSLPSACCVIEGALVGPRGLN